MGAPAPKSEAPARPRISTTIPALAVDVLKHPEAVIPWAKENHDELRKCAKQARKHRIVATGDIGRLSPGDRLAVFNELMNEEYVKVGKVHVAVAKAVEFLHRDDKAIRELLGLSELADIGYEAFLFRERFAHHATGFVKNPDGSIGARFVDVKNAQTLNSIQTAISKSVLQGEGAVIIYNGLETFSRVLEEITGRLEENVQQGQHFVFAKMQRSKEVGFVVAYKYDSGVITDAATRWPGAHELSSWLSLPPDNITEKNRIVKRKSRNRHAINGLQSI